MGTLYDYLENETEEERVARQLELVERADRLPEPPAWYVKNLRSTPKLPTRPRRRK